MLSIDELVRDYWNRAPAVLGSAVDCFGTATELRDGLRAVAALPRIYVDGKAIAPCAGDACGDADVSIEAYVDRLIRDHAATQLTCIAKELETSHERIWFGCGRFLRALYARIGLPAGAASLSLFAGRYGKTPFGCHKDVDHVITYVIAGRKRFLVWPFEVVAEHLGIAPEIRDRAVLLETFDYNAIRDRATVLEGGPGDLLYWPWDHWHVAESDGELTASLSLGIAPHGTRAIDDELLDRTTRFAFRAPIPAASVGAPFAATDLLRPALPDLIAWQEAEQLSVSVNGHGFTVEPRPELTALIAELNTGDPVQVHALRARYPGLDAEELDQILEALLAFRAFAREPAPDPRSPALFERSDWHPMGFVGADLQLALIPEHQHRDLEGSVSAVTHVPVDLLLALPRPAPRRPRYLFTAGYCGSTLISRCLDAIAHCFTINEPRVLDVCDDRRRLELVAALLFRANHPAGKVVVKGGEGATAWMEDLLQIGPEPTGVLLYVSLPTFLASTLKTADRRAEFRRVVASPARARLMQTLGLPAIPSTLSDARAIATVWLTDRALYDRLRAREARLRALDFDAFLADPAGGIRALADHFALDLPAGGEHAIARGDMFHTHAKRQDAAFDTGARRTALAAQHARYHTEIADALGYCRELWGGEPPARLGGDLI
ncbi:MAG: hypothetical protein ABI867_02015 [Kofleriaceae bacterium]